MRPRHSLGVGSEPGIAGELVQQHVTRLAVVTGHLEGEPAALADVADQPWKQVQVAGDPLVRRIGDQYVDGFGGFPRAHVAGLEPDTSELPLPGALDHLRRGVDAEHVRGAPALREQRRQIPGATAEVDDATRSFGTDAGEQVHEGPAALVGVDQVTVRVPDIYALRFS